MFAQMTSALLRAVLMAWLVVIPALMLPGVGSDAQQFAFIIGLLAAVFVFVEYFSTYPSLLEFRFAPPFNRIRFAAVFCFVFAMSLVYGNDSNPNVLNGILSALSHLLANLTDVPYSPVRLVLLALPEDLETLAVYNIRLAVALSYTIAVVSLVVFYLLVRFKNWPTRNGAFNVWVNLPLFDPTTGGDVLARLTRDGRFNVVLGLLLPFILPALAKLLPQVFGGIDWANTHTVIWTMTFWAFLPATMVMRGLAMLRLSAMIDHDRRRAYAEAQDLQHI